MSVIGFWSGSNKETGQTASIAAVATQMALEHNYKILLIDATFDDDSLERCYWNTKSSKKDVTQKLNKGKIDISSGAEGLVSAVASNKATPEIVSNYTRVVFRGRLDVLCGLKTAIPEEFSKSLMLYKDLINTANKHYDMVLVDLEKTLRFPTTKALLETCSVIVYDITKGLKQADDYLENMAKHADILKKEKVIPVLLNEDENAVYNTKNVTRYLGLKKDIPTIPYNPVYLKASNEAGVSNFFITNVKSKGSKFATANSKFVDSVDNVCIKILDKLKELKYII